MFIQCGEVGYLESCRNGKYPISVIHPRVDYSYSYITLHWELLLTPTLSAISPCKSVKRSPYFSITFLFPFPATHHYCPTTPMLAACNTTTAPTTSHPLLTLNPYVTPSTMIQLPSSQSHLCNSLCTTACSLRVPCTTIAPTHTSTRPPRVHYATKLHTSAIEITTEI